MDERVLGIKRIKNDDERDEEKRLLERDIEEYKWAVQCGSEENMYKGINAAVDELTKKADGGELSEEDKHELAILQRKFRAIKAGSFVPTLLNNIATRFVSQEEFDARKENRSLVNVIVGVFTVNKAVKEYIKRKYTFWVADMTGQFPGANDMELESMEQIVEQIAGLVRLEPNVREEVEEPQEQQQEESKQKEEKTTALVVVPENTPSRFELSVMESVRKFLEERGITEEFSSVAKEKQEEASKVLATKEEIPSASGKTIPNTKTRADEKQTKEIED